MLFPWLPFYSVKMVNYTTECNIFIFSYDMAYEKGYWACNAIDANCFFQRMCFVGQEWGSLICSAYAIYVR